MEQHIKILAVLNMVWGGLGALAGLVVLLIFGGVVGILTQVGIQDQEALVAVPILGIIGVAICFFLLITSVPCIVAGIGLLSLSPWSRVLGVVISALNLLSVPLGTALGIYGLWVLLSEESQPLFQFPSQSNPSI